MFEGWGKCSIWHPQEINESIDSNEVSVEEQHQYDEKYTQSAEDDHQTIEIETLINKNNQSERTDNVVQFAATASSLPEKVARPKRSWVWDHYTKASSTEARCNRCQARAPLLKSSSTTSLTYHLNHIHSIFKPTDNGVPQKPVAKGTEKRQTTLANCGLIPIVTQERQKNLTYYWQNGLWLICCQPIWCMVVDFGGSCDMFCEDGKFLTEQRLLVHASPHLSSWSETR